MMKCSAGDRSDRKYFEVSGETGVSECLVASGGNTRDPAGLPHPLLSEGEEAV